jgi:hypothetical protein
MKLASGACVAGGAAWIALAAAAQARASDHLGYEAYFRLMAVPLVLFAAGFYGFWREWSPRDPRARWASVTVLLGLVLCAAGTALEFWGVLLQDLPTAHDANGGDAWAGSDIGWSMFMIGFFALLVGGPTVAVRIWRSTPFPRWLGVFVLLLGFGILSGNLLGEQPLYVTLPVFGVFAAGWIALGRWLLLRVQA